jgi:hypothetical protein
VTVEFSYTLGDYLEAPRAKVPKSTRMHRPQSVLVLLMFATIALTLPSSIYLTVRHSLLWLLAAFPSLLMLGILGYYVTLRFTGLEQRRRFAADRHSAGPVQVRVGEAGFVFDKQVWTASVSWSALRDLIETKSLFILVDDTPNSFAVPKRAFASDEVRQEFLRMIRERIAGANGDA